MNYNAYLMYYWNQYVLLRIPYSNNQHMPSGFLHEDKTDFYILTAHYAVDDNLSNCAKARKNTPASYPESLYARNIEQKSNNAPADDFDKGLQASKQGKYKEALDWYTKSAEEGNEYAMYNIGTLYYSKKIEKQASTEYSSADILKNLTRRSEDDPEYKEAFSWFKKSAEKGYDQAMYALGLLYRDGKGIAENKTEAKRWIEKAAAKGHKEAKEALKGF